ncbi:MAG: hypothetical protein IKO72_08985 [Kiritimatiellae bacterium]|nr:hypothetical protein [Kiritimatiellia bacterium]
MNTAASEWAAQVADRNEIETAKARFEQTEFDFGARNDDRAAAKGKAEVE